VKHNQINITQVTIMCAAYPVTIKKMHIKKLLGVALLRCCLIKSKYKKQKRNKMATVEPLRRDPTHIN
jgi:hypothetical protein